VRPVSLALTVLGVGAAVAVGASWATFARDIVLRQRAEVEWTGLTQTLDSLRAGHGPYNSDAAMFVSSKAVGQALKLLAGATVTTPSAAKYGDVKIDIKDVGLQPSYGSTGVTLQLEISSSQRGLTIDVTADASLAFRAVRTTTAADGHTLAIADFALSILSVEPRLKWGFLDISGRKFVSELISSGAILAVDKSLIVSLPFEDRVAFNTKIDTKTTVPTDAGSVTLAVTLPGTVLEQRFAFAVPLYLHSGIWLLASAAENGQTAIPAPVLPNLPTAELTKQVVLLQTELTKAAQGLDQTADFVLWLKASALASLVDKLKALPAENRTVTIQSVATTGQLISDGKSYAELSNPSAATAHIVIAPPSTQWIPNKGVALSLAAKADFTASMHAHANPPVGGGFGTTVGLVGSAEPTVSGALNLEKQEVVGHSVVLVGLDLACQSIDAELRTDGKLVAGPLHTDMPSIGLRWSIPIPRSLGDPNVIIDDIPRRLSLLGSNPDKDAMPLKPEHPAAEVTTRVLAASAVQEGYLITAELNIQATDDSHATQDEVAQRAAIAKSVADSANAEAGSCPSNPNFRVLIGGLEIGPNGFVWKTLYNALNDLTHGPGPNNEAVKAVNNAEHDLTHGPGPSNDAVKTLDNAAHDLIHGPGPNNDAVKIFKKISPF
jgi:hypothetical protein